jgi:osmoprotectant transport system permease protein
MLAGLGSASEVRPLVIGSKNFTESYILSEILAQLIEAEGLAVERRFGLGGTLISFDALRGGEIDAYVEYTGTVSQAILGLSADATIVQLNLDLQERGVGFLGPFGFNNTYALALKAEAAAELGLASISDLVPQADLRVMVSHEFLERADGWPGLIATYGFDWVPTGIEHGLAYQALADGSIDVTDVYSTDGELVRYGLTVLKDDRNFFPRYLAAPLVRLDLPASVVAVFHQLEGSIDDATMQRLNAAVVFGGETFAEVATGFLQEQGIATIESMRPGRWNSLRKNTLTHLKLTGIALFGAILVGVALGVAVYRMRALSRTVLYIAGLLQTIPSIALLALMIPLFGIGVVPAIIALFLYSLLPILRNTITALTSLDPLLERVAVAMGLTPREQLRYVYLPMSVPGVLAGIRTAAVISIGTATLAAFIGAGGLGDPIVTGLALNDTSLILQGAIPAALLAIATELIFEGVERALLPRHLLQSTL